MTLEKNVINNSADKLGKGECYSELPETVKKICHERKLALTEKEKYESHKLVSGAVINMFEKKFRNRKTA